MGETERPLALGIVGISECAGLGNMTNRIGTLVTIERRVGSASDSDRIHHKDHGAHVDTSNGSA